MALAGGLSGCGASLNEGTQSTTAQLDQKIGAGGIVPAAGQTGFVQTGAAAQAGPQAGQQPGGQSLAKAATELTAVSTPGSSAYKIGPQDVLDVSVFKVPDLTKSVQVADTGSINLPLVGEIPAAGKTAQEVERDLTKLLGAKYLQSPQVTVFVKEYNSQRVTVEGAVKKPGVYPIRGRSSLLQVIATAEGLTDVAESEVVIFREVAGKRTAAKFNIQDVRAGRADDPQMHQGDTVVVSTSALASAYQNFLKALPIGSFVALL